MRGRVAGLGGGGDGIVEQPDGKRWFVPLAAPGDEIEFDPLKGQGRNGPMRGRLNAIHEPGPNRVSPPCQHFGKCGGCALQHLSHDFMTGWKLEQVRTALSRRGLDDVSVTMGVEGAAGRRRRVTLTSVRPGKALPVLGFHERRGRNVIALKSCPVLEDDLQSVLQPLRELLAVVQPPSSEVRVSMNMTDGGVDLLLDGGLTDSLQAHEELAAFCDAHDLARLSVADGDAPRTIASRRSPVLDWGRLKVTPAPGAFLQADRSAEAFMRRMVSDLTRDCERPVDLFCGVGTLTAALPLGAGTLAVDSDAVAVERLKRGLDAARLDARTEMRNLFRRPLQDRELENFDLAVLDPPAAGAKEQCQALAASPVPKLVYVSCAPATFARDARILVDAGYRLTDVQVIDQFYWSSEVELLSVLERT